jgi:hypothetical protein
MVTIKEFWNFLKRSANFLEKSHNLADWIFTIIILFISTTSFFHVVEYWTLTNKFPFHFITAIATELVIIGSMMAIRYTGVSWIPFILGVIVQGIGNIFYSYININVDSEYFKQFMELFKPLFELAYGDELEIANYKRVLAYSNGLFYLSPIVFLWAKMSLKTKIKKLESESNSNGVSTTPTAPTTPIEPIIPPSTPEPTPVVEPEIIPEIKELTEPELVVEPSEITPEETIKDYKWEPQDAEEELSKLLLQPEYIGEPEPQPEVEAEPKLEITIPTEVGENSIIDKMIESPIIEKKN